MGRAVGAAVPEVDLPGAVVELGGHVAMRMLAGSHVVDAYGAHGRSALLVCDVLAGHGRERRRSIT